MENLETIPIDLIIKILSKLPAKPIARCRCVSKLWAIKGNPYFTDMFMTMSCARPQLLFSLRKSREVVFFSSPQVGNLDENSCLVAANHLMKFPIDFSSKIRGPVNGLMCLTNFQYGRKGNGDGDIIRKHQVLTLGTQKLSWRTIECCISYQYPCENDGICINGVLYYPVMVIGPPNGYALICFDVRSEKFRGVNIPEEILLLWGDDDNMLKWSVSLILVNYKGKLGVLLQDMFSFYLWVLIDAEKHEWSKHKYVLPSSWKNVVAEANILIVGVTSTNEIVLSPRNLSNPFYVFYYNIERNTIRRVEIQGMDAFRYYNVHISLDHVEDVKLLQNV
ncbi:hypothetical protein EUTSA_v10019719mg [Eutrema salsugineum]|uniref:F-box domain-containing protein n=1 Tax=Eutrema salsugineum TaxID=72664 RepID=V4KN95_EUTSA|nr:hypothetical protein EUTSA_v10019719mg [Eutrema salsugineum]